MTFRVRYQIGPYSGVRHVNAEDEDEAIAKVRAWVNRECSLGMASQSYKVLHGDNNR